MTIEEARQIHLIDYLSRIGHQPQKIRGNSYWYLSPFRQENTASFKVDKTLNVWYDFGEGKGGNLISFGTHVHNCSVQEFLQRLSGIAPGTSILINKGIKQPKEADQNSRIKVLSSAPIASRALQHYGQTRGIPHEILRSHCDEVTYSLKDKTYFALGFRNDSGGYELRNLFFKAGSSPKDTTLISNGGKQLAVFEGFFNFLSYRTLYDEKQGDLKDYLILNSVSFFDKSISRMTSYEGVQLYLDRDKTGHIFTQKGLSIDKKKFTDERGLYKNHNDLNDYLVHFGQSRKQSLKHLR